MNRFCVAFLVGCTALNTGALLAQETKEGGVAPAPKHNLSSRIEVEGFDRCFTVRLYIKNSGEDDVQVVTGRGSSGLSVVPQIRLGDMTVNPPTYFHPPRRSMRPDKRTLPAGKEVLYGIFTMGYPPADRAHETEVTAYLHFAEFKEGLLTEPQKLKLPKTDLDQFRER